MDSEIFARWTDAAQAGVNFARVVRPWCHEMWKQGKEVAAHLMDAEEAQSLSLLREYWGYILRPISQQAQIAGIGATVDGWHLYYKREILGYEFVKTRLPGKKRAVVRKQLPSVGELAKRPTKMRKYMEEVRAHAATTFGVTFPALEDR